ncbi:LOW QUALITY PROTEIN: hypothetical protein MKX08_007831 [Trichoderma sp. CBMAI-0020]|nr:LOW QUALITY PROTEIN: hypothetical protein MKX08_007831 [Trichoderma sp. CBMAI-0020]
MAEFPPAFKAGAAYLADRDRPPRHRKAYSIRGVAAQFNLIAAANDLQRRKDPIIADLGKNWYSQWLLDHPEVQKSYIKAVEKARKSFKASNVENLMTFFDKLKETITTFHISALECWNEDECGIRLGCLRERVAIIRITRSQRPQVLNPLNRESSTIIGSINAAGESISPWLIFKTFPTESWAEVKANKAIHFARSKIGFSNTYSSRLSLPIRKSFKHLSLQGISPLLGRILLRRSKPLRGRLYKA